MSASYKTPTSRSITGLRTFSKRTAGFIQGVILFGIALLAIVIAAFAFSNKSSNMSTTAEQDKTFASSIIASGSQMRTAADRYRVDRGTLSTLTLSESDTSGLFNTTDKFLVPPVLNNKAFTSTSDLKSNTQYLNFYLAKSTSTVNKQVGSVSSAYIIFTGPLLESVCRRINYALYGSNAPTTMPSAGVEAAKLYDDVTAINLTAASFGNAQNLEEGCVKTSNDTPAHYYFKVIGQL